MKEIQDWLVRPLPNIVRHRPMEEASANVLKLQ